MEINKNVHKKITFLKKILIDFYIKLYTGFLLNIFIIKVAFNI